MARLLAIEKDVTDLADVFNELTLTLDPLRAIRDRLTDEVQWRGRGLDPKNALMIVEEGLALALAIRFMEGLVETGHKKVLTDRKKGT